jgi:hypothetical protein
MKYDKHHIDKIIKSLEDGDGRVRACKNAGIDYQTFLNWLNDKDKLDFFEAVKKAEDYGNDKIKDICKRKIIEDKSWQSGAWWLERNYPDEYKLQQGLEHKGMNLTIKTKNKKEKNILDDID